METCISLGKNFAVHTKKAYRNGFNSWKKFLFKSQSKKPHDMYNKSKDNERNDKEKEGERDRE